MGDAAEARAFAAGRHMPFPLLVDGDKDSYEMLGFERAGLATVIGPRVWRHGLVSLFKGHGIAAPRQDALQLGGAAVLRPDGTIAYRHQAASSSDNAPVDDLISALDELAAHGRD